MPLDRNTENEIGSHPREGARNLVATVGTECVYCGFQTGQYELRGHALMELYRHFDASLECAERFDKEHKA